uniref:Transposase Helix-turn-helix domain-containing protein n=1 Tax=Amphimedon queenslandica TaxID=400682 RepID=A0A1X7UD02_AMPQE
MTEFYTGLQYYDVYETLFSLLKVKVKESITRKCTIKDEILLTLVKLKLGLTNQDIAYCTGINVNKVSPIFQRWLDIMYREFRQLIAWPERERLYETLPVTFKKHYFDLICQY